MFSYIQLFGLLGFVLNTVKLVNQGFEAAGLLILEFKRFILLTAGKSFYNFRKVPFTGFPFISHCLGSVGVQHVPCLGLLVVSESIHCKN